MFILKRPNRNLKNLKKFYKKNFSNFVYRETTTILLNLA